MSFVSFLGKGFSQFSLFMCKIYYYVLYRPKGHFIDKSVQTNKMKKPCIIIANHTSLCDPVLMMSIVHGKKHIVIAKDWYEKPNLHWILSGINCIPCDRFNMDSEWLNLAKKALNKGESVIIFPEGKLRAEKDGVLNEFKSGFAFLARYTGYPVVSFGLDGKYNFGHRIHYVVDVPENVVRTKGIPSGQDLEQKSAYFQEKVKNLKAQALNKGKIVK